MGFPPSKQSKQIRALIARAHPSDREDLLQEAWLAHLSGENPVSAVNQQRMSEHRRRQRTTPIIQTMFGIAARDRDGSLSNN